MTGILKSGFHIACIGIVTADKVKGDLLLQVHPKELLPNTHGKLLDKKEVHTTDTQDNKNRMVSGKTTHATSITCKWLDLFGHSPLAPDVRVGERVLVWRQSDSQDYYWTPLNLDQDKRLLEEVVFMASDTKVEDRKPKTLSYDNTYSIKMDTYDKFVRIRTCKNDGEAFIHELLLDPKNKFSVLRDDVGNRIKLDSGNTIIILENKDKTKYELNKKNINVYCGGNYTQKTEGNYSLDIGGNLTTKVGGTIGITSGGSYSLKSSGVSVDTSSVTVNSPTSDFSGKVSCVSLAISGGGGGGPSCTISGNVSGTGDWKIDGVLEVNEIKVGGGGIDSAGDVVAPNI